MENETVGDKPTEAVDWGANTKSKESKLLPLKTSSWECTFISKAWWFIAIYWLTGKSEKKNKTV